MSWYKLQSRNRAIHSIAVLCYAMFFISLLFGNYGTVSYQFADIIWTTHIEPNMLATWERARAVGIFITWAAGLPIFLFLKSHHQELALRSYLDLAITSFTVFYGWMMIAAFFSRSIGL